MLSGQQHVKLGRLGRKQYCGVVLQSIDWVVCPCHGQLDLSVKDGQRNTPEEVFVNYITILPGKKKARTKCSKL